MCVLQEIDASTQGHLDLFDATVAEFQANHDHGPAVYIIINLDNALGGLILFPLSHQLGTLARETL
jgi:hypothetical protein